MMTYPNLCHLLGSPFSSLSESSLGSGDSHPPPHQTATASAMASWVLQYGDHCSWGTVTDVLKQEVGGVLHPRRAAQILSSSPTAKQSSSCTFNISKDLGGDGRKSLCDVEWQTGYLTTGCWTWRTAELLPGCSHSWMLPTSARCPSSCNWISLVPRGWSNLTLR